MTWIKLDASVHKHHKLAALPSNDARWAFIVTLCEGKAWGGVWHSRAHYQTCVGNLAKHLDVLVGVGLMEIDDDGTVSVHDWPDYQRDVDANAAERSRRYRERRSSRVTGRDVTAPNALNSTVHTVRDVTERTQQVVRALPEIDSYDGLPHISKETQSVGERLTGRGILTAGDRQITELDRLIEDHGDAKVQDAMTAVADGKQMTWRQLIWGAMKRLEPIPAASRKDDAEEENRARWARERAATRRMIEQRT